MSRPYLERWGDMRDNCDQALKLVGMLPSAISCAADDPDFIEETIRRLSDQLCCLDTNIGDEKPVIEPGGEPRSETELSAAEDRARELWPEKPAAASIASEARWGLDALRLAREEVFAFLADIKDDDVAVRAQRLSAIADGILPALNSLEAILRESGASK